jgi:hypothetical protein
VKALGRAREGAGEGRSQGGSGRCVPGKVQGGREQGRVCAEEGERACWGGREGTREGGRAPGREAAREGMVRGWLWEGEHGMVSTGGGHRRG